MRRRGCVAVLLLAMLRLAGPAHAVAVPAAHTPLCGTRTTPPPTYAHVVWIWLENHGYDQIVGASDAPYINHTLIGGCGLATNYHNLTHPSLPNYIGATSGLPLSRLGAFMGNCNAFGPCLIGTSSLFAQVPSWRAYEESMPAPCAHFFHAPYAASHNPAVYYRKLTNCRTADVPFDKLQRDLDADTLPAFSFVGPNLCDSMHSCSVAIGDGWLARVVPRIVASAAYQAGTTAIFVTWDEGERGGSNHCATNTADSGCRVATIVISPTTVPGTRSGMLFNHYALLRTTEELLGVPFLRQARRARSMRAAFML